MRSFFNRPFDVRLDLTLARPEEGHVQIPIATDDRRARAESCLPLRTTVLFSTIRDHLKWNILDKERHRKFQMIHDQCAQ